MNLEILIRIMTVMNIEMVMSGFYSVLNGCHDYSDGDVQILFRILMAVMNIEMVMQSLN